VNPEVKQTFRETGLDSRTSGSQSDIEDDLLPLRKARAKKRSSKLNWVPRDFKMSVSRDSSETDCDSPTRHKIQPILKSSAYTKDIEHGGAKPKPHIHTKPYNDTDAGSSHYSEQKQDTNRQNITRNEMRHTYTYHRPTPTVEKEFENKGNNKITEVRTILQRESQNS
jgi:hypothetical protein